MNDQLDREVIMKYAKQIGIAIAIIAHVVWHHLNIGLLSGHGKCLCRLLFVGFLPDSYCYCCDFCWNKAV